jgi:hypothetical protein
MMKRGKHIQQGRRQARERERGLLVCNNRTGRVVHVYMHACMHANEDDEDGDEERDRHPTN